MSHTRIYRIWDGMVGRCCRPTAGAYPKYGAKGITVCREWRDDFRAFYQWAIANGYKDGLSLDRIESSGNYEPSNCRWMTMKAQQNNRSNNRLIEHNGEMLTLSQWAERAGISPNMLRKRLMRGWDIQKALTTKIIK